MSSERWQPPPPAPSPPTRVDEVASTRDLFVLVLGLAGLAVGVLFGYGITGRNSSEAASWAAWAVPVSAAVTAVMTHEFFQALTHRRRVALVLVRLSLLGLNAMLLVAEVMVLVVATTLKPGLPG